MPIPASDIIASWRRYPQKFVYDNFAQDDPKFKIDWWQADLLERFVSDNPEYVRMALKACAGPGKSCGEAWCAWLFMSCYGEKGEHPKGAAVAITKENLRDNLWSEMAKWQNRSQFLKEAFTWTQSKIFAKGFAETWFLSARSFPQTADTETLGKTLSGIHGKYVLFLIDESGDIPPQIAKAAEQAVGETLGRNGFVRILQAGNPISLAGMLYTSLTNGKWSVIEITADPDDPRRSGRIDKALSLIHI